MSINKSKLNFITIFATGIFKQSDYTLEALDRAEITQDDLNEWLFNDEVFGKIYYGLQSQTADIMTIQRYMDYVNILKNLVQVT